MERDKEEHKRGKVRAVHRAYSNIPTGFRAEEFQLQYLSLDLISLSPVPPTFIDGVSLP